MTEDTITILPGSRFRAAMVLAVIADALWPSWCPDRDNRDYRDES